MSWKHLRKQDVSFGVVSQWDDYLKEAGIDISAYNFDEFHHFDSGHIKIKASSKEEFIISNEAREDRRPSEIQGLRDFLNEHAEIKTEGAKF